MLLNCSMHLNALSSNLRIYNQAMGSNPAGKVCMEVAEGKHCLLSLCCLLLLSVAVDAVLALLWVWRCIAVCEFALCSALCSQRCVCRWFPLPLVAGNVGISSPRLWLMRRLSRGWIVSNSPWLCCCGPYFLSLSAFLYVLTNPTQVIWVEQPYAHSPPHWTARILSRS